jgi:C4-dicarboxylate-specific signal transduction histidine kinase
VAHEINNPAAFIMSNLGVLGEHAATLTDAFARLRAVSAGAASVEGAAVRDLLDTVRPETLLAEVRDIVSENTAGMERIVGIVRQLKGFAHPGNDGAESVDLNDVVLDACKLMPVPRLRRLDAGARPGQAADRGGPGIGPFPPARVAAVSRWMASQAG